MTEELSKGFTGIEINGVRFSNIKEMLIYMDKQRDRIIELEKENAELKEQISTKDIMIKELQEQKVYWKESSFDWRHKFFKLDKVKRLIKKDKQLTKAKELLKWALHSDPEHDEDFEKKWSEAEQFLKDSEVKK